MNEDKEEQEDELLALHSIFESEEFFRDEAKAAGEIRVSVELPTGFSVALKEGETLRQYEISSLPPLRLTFELPEDYPSSSPPSFSLTCSWLTHPQLSALRAQLTELYQATGGAVVLFTWVQFLREDALKFLDIHTLLELPTGEHSTSLPQTHRHTPDSGPADNPSCHVSDPPDPEPPFEHPIEIHGKSPSDSPVASGQNNPTSQHIRNKDLTDSGLSLTPSQALLSRLLIHDATEQQKRFSTTVFDCGVCFVGFLGSDCVHLPECGHVFCRACLGQFCKLQITEGNVRGVACPQADCPATPTPAQVKSLVGEELFRRYDRLLLQNSLDSMPDVVYCPRRSCGSAVIREKSAAMCSVCGFAFCVTCRRTYHGIGDCRGKMSMKKKAGEEEDTQGATAELPHSLEGIQALWDDYTTGSKERRRLLESRYSRRVLQFTVEEGLSENWIGVNSKNCPYCFSKIEKDGGCNRMTCSRCRRFFCWVCLAPLPANYSGLHFQDGPCSVYQYRYYEDRILT